MTRAIQPVNDCDCRDKVINKIRLIDLLRQRKTNNALCKTGEAVNPARNREIWIASPVHRGNEPGMHIGNTRVSGPGI